MGTVINSETIILDLLRLRKSLRMEQLIELAPELTWNQVFTTIDSLSRRGDIALLRRGFDYEIAWVPVRGQAVACSA